jgi:hypothetical protein
MMREKYCLLIEKIRLTRRANRIGSFWGTHPSCGCAWHAHKTTAGEIFNNSLFCAYQKKNSLFCERRNWDWNWNKWPAGLLQSSSVHCTVIMQRRSREWWAGEQYGTNPCIMKPCIQDSNSSDQSGRRRSCVGKWTSNEWTSCSTTREYLLGGV